MSAYQNVTQRARGGRVQPVVLSNHYRLIREIGRGAYGSVHLAADITVTPEEMCVVKMFQRREEVLKSAQVEYTTLSALKNHRGVVTLLGDLDLDDVYCLVLSRERMNLLTLAGKTEKGKLGTKAITKIVYDVCTTLEYIHSQNYIHRDIKPENLMLGSDLNATIQIKLIDFGVAKYFRKRFDITKRDNMYTNCFYSSGRMSAGMAATPRDDIVMMLFSVMKVQMEVMPLDRSNIERSRADRLLFETKWHRDHYHLPPNLYHLAASIFAGGPSFYPNYNAIKETIKKAYPRFDPSTDILRFDSQQNGTIIIS
uniref:Protein kinase domain-containing protein n=1 Tax=Caenorhabditis tropicalis TaxID=1561998 RepID=A0A1I7UPQ3_9PELO